MNQTCTSSNRRDHVYVCSFDAVELDLLYELARHARNGLPYAEDEIEDGSWGDAIIKLDVKLTELFYKRRR
jgi:hypothetical protein